MNKNLIAISIYCVPIALMIGLISYVQNDYGLALLYIIFIIAIMLIKSEKYDLHALMLGVIVVTLFELLFVSTGVETFRNPSLFHLIPAWLPFLWGYAFVTIKRSLNLLP